VRASLLVVILCLSVGSAFGQWEPDQRLTNDPADSYLCGQQCIVADGDTLHVIFTDNRTGGYSIYYMRSLDAGVTWDSAVQLSPGDSNRIFSGVIAADGPDVHVVWTASNDQALLYRRSTDAGASWPAEETLVVSPMGLSGPFLSTGGGRVGLAWGDERDGHSNGEMYYKESSDDGENWTPDTRLTFGPDTSADGEACLVLADNYRYIVWSRYNWHTYVRTAWFMRSIDNGATWEPRVHITDDTTGQSQPMVAVVGSNVHVTWFDSRDSAPGIHYHHSTDFGVTWNTERYLTNLTYGSDYPCIAASGGNVYLAYRAWPAGQFVIDYRGSTDNGQTWSAETALTTAAGMGTADLAATGNRAHMLLYDNRDGNSEIYHKRNLTAGGVEERPAPDASRVTLAATVVRGMLLLPSSSFDISHSSLLDASGRKVLAVHPGLNDVSRLAPGIYFVREAQAIRKIIVTR
jgi:hypothetical protein